MATSNFYWICMSLFGGFQNLCFILSLKFIDLALCFSVSITECVLKTFCLEHISVNSHLTSDTCTDIGL